MASAGYYRLTRGWMDHSMFGQEPYCRRAAWVWMIEHAAFGPHTARLGGREFTLKRGQLIASVRHMGREWEWEPARVHRFLKRLEKRNSIATAGATVGATAQRIITIWNYEKYQATPATTATPTVTPPDSKPQQERIARNTVPYGTASTKLSPSAATINPAAVLFDQCLDYLMANGVKEGHARSVIDGWRKEYGAGAVIEVVTEASQQAVSEPVAWIAKALRTRHGPPEYREVAPL